MADDKLGSEREQFLDPLPESYLAAFTAIDRDPNQELIVVESASGIIGTMQLSFLTYLTYRGGMRAQIEAVRVDHTLRGQGIGESLIQWAIKRAQLRGAHVVQLTTDKQRPGAIAFYEKLGFRATHEGMKLHLEVKQHRSTGQ